MTTWIPAILAGFLLLLIACTYLWWDGSQRLNDCLADFGTNDEEATP